MNNVVDFTLYRALREVADNMSDDELCALDVSMEQIDMADESEVTAFLASIFNLADQSDRE